MLPADTQPRLTTELLFPGAWKADGPAQGSGVAPWVSHSGTGARG